MWSPEELRTAPSDEGIHLSVLIDQALFLQGPKSAQNLARIAFGNVLQLVCADWKLSSGPSLAHVIEDVGLAALQLVCGLLHRLSSQDALTIAVVNPAFILQLDQQCCAFGAALRLHHNAVIVLGLALGWLLEPVHQDREAGRSRECVAAPAGLRCIATAHALVRVVDHRQRGLVRGQGLSKLAGWAVKAAGSFF